MGKKKHGEPVGKIVKIVPGITIERRTSSNGGSSERWDEVFAVFDKLMPSKTNGIGVELENESEVWRCQSAIHGRAQKTVHSDWKPRTSSRKLPNGNFFIYLWKEPLTNK